jgi:hypothetical protein
MTYCYIDPIDSNLHWEAHKTVQIGFTEMDDRLSMTALLTHRRATVFDLYRAPTLLISDIFAYPSILRVMDYTTYQIVEDQIKNRIKHISDPLEVAPVIVYGACNDQLLDHISVINGSTTHPHLISAYYIQITKGL